MKSMSYRKRKVESRKLKNMREPRVRDYQKTIYASVWQLTNEVE